MATYLVSVQIGRYDVLALGAARYRCGAACPPRLRRDAAHDFGRQPAMMTRVQRAVRALPVRRYSVVVTDDELEIPIEAQGMSVFGANHVDGRAPTSGWSRTSWRTSGSATA